MSETLNVDEAIRVVVAPSQASYFAGEPFSVTITFTNTRTPDATTPRSASHTHKRSAHSISSVPMARPPTSPGLLKTALPAVPTRNAESTVALTRKGLIGKGHTLNGLGVNPGVVAVQARRPVSKSLSIHITAPDLEGESAKGKSPLNPLRANGSLAACEFYGICFEGHVHRVFSTFLTPYTIASREIDFISTGFFAPPRPKTVGNGRQYPDTRPQTTSQPLALVRNQQSIQLLLLTVS